MTLSTQVKDQGYTIIKFHAKWCAPCKVMIPIMDEIQAEDNDIEVVSIDVDVESEISEEANIRSVPTLLFYKDGELIGRNSGGMNKTLIMDVISGKRKLST